MLQNNLNLRIKLVFLVLIIGFQVFRVGAQKPPTPVFDSIGFNYDETGNRPVLNWHVPAGNPYDGIIVYRQIYDYSGIVDGSYMPIAELDATAKQYTDINEEYGQPGATTRQTTYQLATYADIDGDINYSDLSEEKSTVFLQEPVFDKCAETISLNWENGKNNPPDNARYEIIHQSVVIDQVLHPEQSFLHTIENKDTQHNYYIRFVDGDGFVSLSNLRSLTVDFFEKPRFFDFIYVANASDGAQLHLKSDLQASYQQIIIYKKDKPDQTWSILDSINNKSELYQLEYADIGAQSKIMATMFDVCGNPMQNAYAHLLYIEIDVSNYNSAWNAISWDLGDYSENVSKTSVYKLETYAPELPLTAAPVAELNAENSSWSENIAEIRRQSAVEVGKNPTFYYVIQATGFTESGFDLTLISNILEINQTSHIKIPNAFNPRSMHDINRTFRPEISFYRDFKMQIFSNSGQLLYQTTDVETGWDGTYDNRLMPKDSYLYIIRYSDSSGKIHQYRGSFSLVYN